MAKLLKKKFFTASEVRLVDAEGEQLGIVPTAKAFQMASEAELDLVMVAEKANPPVCRLLDYGKLRYEQKRKQKSQKKHQHAQKLKEIRLHVNIDEHDYKYKINHGIEFLSKGYKLKVSLIFRGREAAHKSIGFDIMQRVVKDLEEYGNTEAKPNLVGRSIIITLNPINKR